jgi:hypothetical protein
MVREFLNFLLGRKQCEKCGEFSRKVKRRHQNTRYVDDESNYVTVCDQCFEEIEEYWKERWAEYYSGCL